MRILAMILVFFCIAFGGVWALFRMVHGAPENSPKLALPSTDEIRARMPDLPSLAPEPAQAPGSGVHKCIGKGGSVMYTDEPCALGEQQKALDPKRSRITTVAPPAQAQPLAASPPAPLKRPVAAELQ